MFGKKAKAGDKGIYLIQDAIATFQLIAEDLEEGAKSCEEEMDTHAETINELTSRREHLANHVTSARNFAGNIRNLIYKSS